MNLFCEGQRTLLGSTAEIKKGRKSVRNFLVEYPLHFVHILLTDQPVIGIGCRFYIRLKRDAVCA